MAAQIAKDLRDDEYHLLDPVLGVCPHMLTFKAAWLIFL